jgi:hypothetical protein
MTKNMLVVVLAATVGCGNLSDPSIGGDDAMEPDGGVPETDAGETPIDPEVLSIVPTQWKDERNDAIDFSTGEPVHTHQGAGVTIAAGGACPAAYRYAYLMDRTPAFGRQVTQNAMEIEIAVPTIALDEAASAYRVTAAGETVIPWTPIGAVPASGRVRIALHRDEMPKLGTYQGELHFDVRVRDTAGVEQLVSACWMHHPMAAPVYVEPMQAALGPTSLTARQLATPSHAIDVLMPTSSALPGVYSARITQQTAEVVTVGFAPAAPTGSFTSTLAYAYLATDTVTAPGSCEDFPESCDMSAVPPVSTTTASGALTTGAWSWTLIDEVTGARMPCSLAGCELPPRASGAAPHPYRVTISGSDFGNLWHQPGTLSAVREVTVPAGQVIGVWMTSNKIRRCTRLKTINGITACQTLTEYTDLAALDRATLAMPALPVQVLTGTSSIPNAVVPYLPNGAVTTPPITWNGGDGPL